MIDFRLLLLCIFLYSCTPTIKAQIATVRVTPAAAGIMQPKISLVLENGELEITPLKNLNLQGVDQMEMFNVMGETADENQKTVTLFLNKMEERGYAMISSSSDGNYFIFRKKE